MKKYLLPFIAALGVISLVSCAPTYVVRERPREVVYFRPAAPSPVHVWVGGDWIWRGGRYEWREGHWENPRGRAHWVDGHWRAARGGWVWVPGHWQR